MNDLSLPQGITTPGLYMQKRREAAGLELDDLATILAGAGSGAADFRAQIVALEAHDLDAFSALTHLTLLDRLDGPIRYDRAVYFALVAAEDNPARPLPPICRGCACSWQDPCLEQTGEDLGPCGWANAGTTEPPLCTRCARDLAAGKPGSEVRHAA
jgi:hypothetical protein